MKSKITLYYKSLLNPEKNFILDDGNGTSKLETYLSSLTKTTINDFQYIKNQLSVSIKINSSQVNLEMIDNKDLNYVKIENYTEVPNSDNVYERAMYYFVTNKIWRSQSTIELVLTMDTLNTFEYNKDYLLNKKTLVKRMHKDRFIQDGLQDYEIAMVEDVLQTLYTSYPDYIELHEDDWVDMGQDVNDYEASLYHEYGASVELVGIYDATLDRMLIQGYEWWDVTGDFQLDDNNEIFMTWSVKLPLDLAGDSFYLQFRVVSSRPRIWKNIDLKSEDISCPLYKKSEENLYENKGAFLNSWVLYYKNKTAQDTSPIECYLTSDTELTFLTETGSNTITAGVIPTGKTYFIAPQYNGIVYFSVNGVNYNVTTQKIASGLITLNYCVGLENQSGTLVFHYCAYQRLGNVFIKSPLVQEILISNPTLECNTSLTQLLVRKTGSPMASSYAKSVFTAGAVTDVITLSALTSRQLAPSYTIDKTDNQNVKIINLPYCPSTITEDNGTYTIEPLWVFDTTPNFFKLVDTSKRFENSVETSVDDIIDIFDESGIVVSINESRHVLDTKLYHSDYYRPKFVYDSFGKVFPLEQIDYLQTLSIYGNSKFKFTFVMSRNIVSKFLFMFNYVYKHSNEDYENVLAVARNNEEVLYTSAYLNYVRTGYNYDLKAKERTEAISGAGIGLSVLGLVLSGAIGMATGNPIAVGSAVASGVGLATSLVNHAKTTAQNEENIQRKLQEAQRQAVSVSNADDYDLLYAYTTNKAKLVYYDVSNNMKNVLDDLFYYAGYIVNEQMLPVINSRYWFNFVQASLVIDDTANLTMELEDDIKEKFEQGVTFLHLHGVFNFKQDKENWEVALIPE